MRTHRRRLALALTALAVTAAACGGTTADDAGETTSTTDPATSGPADTSQPADGVTPDEVEPDAEGPLVVYSGRDEELVGSVIADFEDQFGIEVEVRYGGTAELAATILEEGDNSPADVYWAQDAGALGALQDAGRLTDLSQDVLDFVDPTFRSEQGQWVGVTGRVRTLVYSTDTFSSQDEVPGSVFDLTDEQYAGRVGWAPTNGSFQSFVTAMRTIHGDDVTRQWLSDMLANDVQEFPNNSSQVDAVGRGEIDLGLVNHYYLFRFLAEDPDFPAANKFLSQDVGGLVNVSGVGIVSTTQRPSAAESFVTHLLGQQAQSYFGQVTDELEYPLASGVDADPRLPSLDSLNPPAIDLSDLDDLEGTLTLLREAGALT